MGIAIAINSISTPIFDPSGRHWSRNVQVPRAHNERRAAMAKLAPTVEHIEIFGDVGCSFEGYMTSLLHPLAGVSLHTATGPFKGKPKTSPFPPAAPMDDDNAGDDDDDLNDDGDENWLANRIPRPRNLAEKPRHRVKFPSMITERHPDGRITRRRAER